MPEPGLTVDDLTLPIQAVRNLRHDLDAMSIAEAFWLAAWSGGGAADMDAAKPTAAERRPGEPRARRAAVIWRPERPVSALSAGSLAAGRRVQVARARPLPQQLEITRSLRPFKRRWPRGRRMRLDIGATVAAYTRTWQLVPVYEPAPERWFEVAMLVDDSPSMAVWDEELAGISAVLRHAGTFTTVRDFRLSVPGTGEAPSLFNEVGRQYRADHLRAPDARRVILIVTDGATPGWHRPAVWQMLRAWAATTPTVLISPLPIRLWWRTGLDLPAVRINSVTPGSSNAMLRYSVPLALWEEGNPERVWRPVPAVTLNPRRLARWARMLMRGDPIGSEALLIPPEGRLPDAEPGYDPPPDRDIASAFLRVAAPAAAELAVLCSPFPTLSLPLLRLIRQQLVPDAATADIAEVVISRLFQPQDPADGGDGGILRFTDGARQVLQESLTESDAWRVYDALRARIDWRGSAGLFDAAVLNPSGDVALPSGLPSFAETERGVLDVLGFLDVLPDATVPIVADPASGAADATGDEQGTGSGQE